MPENKCAKCSSVNLIPNVRINSVNPLDTTDDATGQLQAIVEEDPEAWILKRRKRGSLYARICGDCGFTEFFTNNYRELFAAYRKNNA